VMNMHHADLVVVKTFGSRAEAELAKSVLEDAGIQSMIQADTAGGMREHLAWSGAGFKVFVREEDVPAARDALTPTTAGNENENTEREPPQSWRRFT